MADTTTQERDIQTAKNLIAISKAALDADTSFADEATEMATLLGYEKNLRKQINNLDSNLYAGNRDVAIVR